MKPSNGSNVFYRKDQQIKILVVGNKIDLEIAPEKRIGNVCKTHELARMFKDETNMLHRIREILHAQEPRSKLIIDSLKLNHIAVIACFCR
jgi:hypothetical protein